MTLLQPVGAGNIAGHDLRPNAATTLDAQRNVPELDGHAYGAQRRRTYFRANS